MNMDVKRKITASLSVVIPLLCILAIQASCLSWWQAMQDDRETYTQVKEELLRLERLVPAVDNGFRGYVLMKESMFLDPMVAAEGKIPRLLDHLDSMTDPWPDLQSRIRVLSGRVNELLQVKRRLTKEFAQGNEAEVLSYIRGKEGVVLANTIALAFEDLASRVDQRERAQMRDRAQAKTWTHVMFVLTTLGTLGLGMGMGRIVRISTQATFVSGVSVYEK